MLSGYKTYIIATALGVLTTLKTLDIIDDSTFQAILVLLNGAGFAALRHGMK
jgi:hypothetical protein